MCTWKVIGLPHNHCLQIGILLWCNKVWMTNVKVVKHQYNTMSSSVIQGLQKQIVGQIVGAIGKTYII